MGNLELTNPLEIGAKILDMREKIKFIDKRLN
jgi:hypothetical protein